MEHVVAIGGSSASIRLDANPALARITIGNFLGIETDASCVVAVITNVDGTRGVGAFVTEAEQPLLAAATRPINAQAAVRASLRRK